FSSHHPRPLAMLAGVKGRGVLQHLGGHRFFTSKAMVYSWFYELRVVHPQIECQSYGRGAHLASILTNAETLLVAEHISTYQRKLSDVWIGLHDVRQVSVSHLLHSLASRSC
uniref:Uncharacterized protein n=1 Tax=Varanus komodoensis TaxID=61221 RepID=A0A8D2IPL4_VARKO